jgi:hypothetical protein
VALRLLDHDSEESFRHWRLLEGGQMRQKHAEDQLLQQVCLFDCSNEQVDLV